MSDELTLSEARAYKAGRRARQLGKSRQSNPHHCATAAASDKYWAWFSGFDDMQNLRADPHEPDMGTT